MTRLTEHRLSGMGHTGERIRSCINRLGTGKTISTRADGSCECIDTAGRLHGSYRSSLLLLQVRDRLTAGRNNIGTAERSNRRCWCGHRLLRRLRMLKRLLEVADHICRHEDTGTTLR